MMAEFVSKESEELVGEGKPGVLVVIVPNESTKALLKASKRCVFLWKTLFAVNYLT